MNKNKLVNTLSASAFTAIAFASAGTAHADVVPATDLTGIQVTNACVDFFDRCNNPSYYSNNMFASGSGTSATIDSGVEFVSSNVSGSTTYPFYIKANFGADTLHVSYQVTSTGFAPMQLTFDLGLPQGMSLASIVMTGNTLGMDATPVTFSGNHITVNVAGQSINNQTLTADFKIQAVPVPAAAWLLGSGLLGLVGVARRKLA